MAFEIRGADHGGRASRFGYRRDDRHLLGAPPRFKAAMAASGPPPVSDLDHLVIDVPDQGGAPFCFANAVAQALRMCDVRNGVVGPELASRLELVYFAHAIEGDVNAFDGAFISDTFEAIEKLGFAPEAVWPYDDSPTGNFRVRPPEDVLRLSYDQISLDYRRILSTGSQRVLDIATSLADGCPVVFGTDVTEAFASNQLGPDYTYDLPVDGGDGHALVFTGRAPDGRFRVCNSWGPSWGDGGFAWFTEAAVKWRQTRELWSVNFRRGTAVNS